MLRCNAHVFCGGTSSFVLALRMGGEAPHLGLVPTEGSLAGYSIERDVSLQSNDRGCFLLHPAPLELQPGEQPTIAWTICPCAGKEDFFTQAAARSRFLRAEWDRYVLFTGEKSTLTITPSFPTTSVTVAGEPARPAPTARSPPSWLLPNRMTTRWWCRPTSRRCTRGCW